MKRTSTIILAGALALVGCRDMGLEYNLPLEEAMQRPPYALVSAVMAPSDVADMQLIAEGQLWVPAGLPKTMAASDLQPVGTSNGATIYARSWDAPPYDEIFTAVPEQTSPGPAEATGEGRFLGFAPVIGGGRARTGPGDAEAPAAH